MSFFPKVEMVAKEDLQKIHDASMKVLRETGVIYHSEEALDICRKHGVKVEGQTVFYSDKDIESVLSHCTKTFPYTARNPKNSVVVGEQQIVQPGVGPCFVKEMDGTRRPGTRQDYINMQKLCQATDVCTITGTYPIDIYDLNEKEKHLVMMYETIKHTDKPIIGFVNNRTYIDHTLNMYEMSFGKDKFLEDHHCAHIGANPLSPLKWSPDVCDTIMGYASRNQIVAVLPCILAGISGPISLMETVILQNAEILSGIALSKLTNPNAPVIYSPGSTAGFMKKGTYCTGTPEGLMINIANFQLGKDFYKLPVRHMSGMTDAKVPDYQAGFETMQNFLLSVLGGAMFHNECLGVLDFLMSVSFEKFIMDTEIIERVYHIAKGFQGNDYSFSTEAIQEVGHHGEYIMHDSTFEGFRDRWTPSISDWDSHGEWESKGCKTIVERAHEKYVNILARAPETLIDSELDKDLQAYMASVLNA